MKRLLQFSFYALVIALPFGIRHAVTPSIFIYFSDILVVLFLSAFVFLYSNVLKNIRINLLVVFLLLAGLSVFFAASKSLALYGFVQLVLLAALALATAKLLRTGIVKIETLFAALAGSAVFQAILGFLQFWRQGNLGLGFFGEANIGPNVTGIAKVIVAGSKLIRASGTFPHPNVLAGFLLLGLGAFYYFWLRRPSEWKIFSGFKTLASDAVLGVGIFITLFGILISFSRSAWLITIIVSALAVGGGIFRKNSFRQGIRLLVLLISIFYILFSTFRPYISARAQVSASEPAATLRVAYLRLGLDIVKSQPLGVGAGNQVYYSILNSEYKKFGLTQSWQWQPIHNIYLLIASEVGILGLTAFGIFIIKLLISNFKAQMSNQAQSSNSKEFGIWILEFGFAKTLLTSLLLFGLVDHFLWTSEPGKLMLWLTIGIVIGVSSETTETRS